MDDDENQNSKADSSIPTFEPHSSLGDTQFRDPIQSLPSEETLQTIQSSDTTCEGWECEGHYPDDKLRHIYSEPHYKAFRIIEVFELNQFMPLETVRERGEMEQFFVEKFEKYALDIYYKRDETKTFFHPLPSPHDRTLQALSLPPSVKIDPRSYFIQASITLTRQIEENLEVQ